MRNNILICLLLMFIACENKEDYSKFYPKEKYDYVGTMNDNGLRLTSKDFKEGVIDKDDNVIIPTIYEEAIILKNEIVCVKDGKVSLFNLIGNKLFQKKYDDIIPLDNGIYCVKIGETKFLVDENEKIITSLKYNEIFPFDKNIYLVEMNEKYGLINSNGTEIVKPKYKYIHKFSEDLALVLGENEKVGFINRNGLEVIPLNYDYAEDFNGESAFVYRDKKFGIIGTKGELLEPLQNNLIIPIAKNLYVINKNGINFIKNIKNNTLLKTSFDSIGVAKNGVIPVSKNKSFGYIDSNGREVIPINYTKYSYIAERQDDYFVVGNDNFKEGVIDVTGNIIVPLIYNNLDFKSRHLLTGIKNNNLKYIKICKNKSKEFDFKDDDVIEYNDNELIIQNKTGIEIYNLER